MSAVIHLCNCLAPNRQAVHMFFRGTVLVGGTILSTQFDGHLHSLPPGPILVLLAHPAIQSVNKKSAHLTIVEHCTLINLWLTAKYRVLDRITADTQTHV